MWRSNPWSTSAPSFSLTGTVQERLRPARQHLVNQLRPIGTCCQAAELTSLLLEIGITPMDQVHTSEGAARKRAASDGSCLPQLSICLSIYLSISLSLCLSVCLSLSLAVSFSLGLGTVGLAQAKA